MTSSTPRDRIGQVFRRIAVLNLVALAVSGAELGLQPRTGTRERDRISMAIVRDVVHDPRAEMISASNELAAIEPLEGGPCGPGKGTWTATSGDTNDTFV